LPNPIKYSTSAQTLALKKGNFWIGTGDVGKGPTSTTDYYNGITPPSGGYTIYLNKASGGPSIYTAANDSQLISLTNSISGQTFATAAAALDWYNSQVDKMVFDIDYPSIITNGLVLNLDAGFTPSYPTTGTTWYDVSSGGNNGTLTNGPTFSSDNNGLIVFDGVDDYVSIPINSIFNTPSVTFEVRANLQSINDRHILYVNWTGNSLEVNSNRSVVFFNYSNSAGQVGAGTSSGAFNWDSWTHFVGTYDDAGQVLRCYINGSLLGTRSNTPSTTYGIYNHTISGVQFGGEVLGRISMVRHYNRALTAAEVLQNYNATKSRFGL
jgi:hypothetical protein